MTTSRRKFLTASATGAATLAAGTLAHSISHALSISANNKTGTIMDVEHVVILMQENRSFDHYFGTLKGVRGFGDRFTIPLAGGHDVWQQGNGKDNIVLPYHLDQTMGNAQRVHDLSHSWKDAHEAWDDGRMNQWPLHKSSGSMGYYTEAELPFQFALANAFTICDAYYCGMHTGTNSNRLFHWSGTNGPHGELAGGGKAKVSSIDNAWENLGAAKYATHGCNWKTFPERLQDAKVSWIVYQNLPDNFTDNPLAGFQQYRAANKDSGKNADCYDGDASPPKGVKVPAYDPNDDAHNPLYKGIANTMPDGGLLDQFRKDVLAGKLPQVSWVVAPDTYSEHPGPSSPVQGGWYIQQVLDALTAAPDVWSKTVFIVNFDENDGFFDHMPPPSAPSLVDRNKLAGAVAGKSTLSDADMAYERHVWPLIYNPEKPNAAPPDGHVYGPGPRVPMYILSPWTRGGWVNSQVFDHTSVLRFMETRFGVKENGISPYRRAIAGDLTSAFDFATPNTGPPPELAGRKSKEAADTLRKQQENQEYVPVPAEGKRPVQPTGTRPSRALPYELHTSARADATTGTVRLQFSNTGKAAAVFHVYDKLHLDHRLPRRYMVEAGKTLDDSWNAMVDNAGAYDLWVLGPNGWHRHFKGDLNTLRARGVAQPEVLVRYDVANGDIYLDMRNEGVAACTFTVKAKAYSTDKPSSFTVKGGAPTTKLWKLSASRHWYDFEVTCDNDKTYSRRFAGRVETGKHGVSDPAMGMKDL